jgi:hypothetical protein
LAIAQRVLVAEMEALQPTGSTSDYLTAVIFSTMDNNSFPMRHQSLGWGRPSWPGTCFYMDVEVYATIALDWRGEKTTLPDPDHGGQVCQ